jgi:HlyD family secretion protein
LREFLKEKPGSADENPLFINDEDMPKSIFAEQPSVQFRVARFLNTNRSRIIWMAVMAVIGLATYLYMSAPTKVEDAVVKAVQTAETLGATGKVTGERSTSLGLDIQGIVQRTYAKEGDSVRAGQLILAVGRSDMEAGADASRAAVSSAEADLAKASRPALRSEIAQARAEIAQADLVGRAKIAEAQARMRDLRAGTRSQEIAEAQAELRSRRSLLAKAELDARRNARLVAAGALPQAQLDSAMTQVETDRESVIAQQQKLSLLTAGPRPDVLAEARAAVTEAQANRETGVRASSERLNTLLATPRAEDVRAARAKVEQARAELRRSLATTAKADLRAPFDGVIADFLVQEGQSVTPGQELVAFEEISRPVVEVETDESNLGTLSAGMKAVVSSDAYPGRTFEAVLFDLGAKADPERGTVKIKLRPTSSVGWLRPDLTVDVNIVTSASARRVILPPDTITRVGRTSAVFVVRDGVTVPVRVTTNAVGADGVVVRGDLRDGDQVVRNATLVGPKQRVRVVRGN